MQRSDVLHRLVDGALSRRQLAKLLASAGLTMAIMPLAPRLSRAEEQATYFTWSGYDVPEFFPGYVAKH
ncbi:MAG: hypothetical protein ACREEE_11460, partial [Dongiaceae bacterium]